MWKRKGGENEELGRIPYTKKWFMKAASVTNRRKLGSVKVRSEWGWRRLTKTSWLDSLVAIDFDATSLRV